MPTLGNLEEMDKFLKAYTQSTKTEPGRNRKTEQTNKKKQDWFSSKKYPKKNLGLDGFINEFYKYCKKELTAILLNLFWKTQRGESSQTHFMRWPLLWYQKTVKNTTTKKWNYRPLILTNIDGKKILNKIWENQIQQHIKKTTYHDQVRFIPWHKHGSTHTSQ